MRRVIYPATRAVEHAKRLPGIQPVRFFPVLWPLWQVEVSADIYDEQKFELIDHFIVRAVEEAAITDRRELTAFLGLPAGIVDRCLNFLGLIGHVTVNGQQLALTDLGRTSVRAGIRYVAKHSRQPILVERYTGWPLPRPYYDGEVPVLDTPHFEEGQLSDRTRFLRVFVHEPFRPEVLTRLEQDPERARFNLPSQLRNLRQESCRDGYLPCYLIETVDGRILAYSNVSQGRDEFLEQVCGHASVRGLIEAQEVKDPALLWPQWLAQSKVFGSGRLRRGRDGAWEVSLPPGAFGEPPKPPLARIGSYQFWDNHFIRIWCDDTGARRRAMLERALGIAASSETATVDDLLQGVRDLAQGLRVPEAALQELRNHAEKAGNIRALNRIDEFSL